jgi:hypothetical protein
MGSYFSPPFTSASPCGSYGSYPYTHPAMEGHYPYTYPISEESYPYVYPVAGGPYPYVYPVAGGSYPYYSYPMTVGSYPYSHPNGGYSTEGFHPWHMPMNPPWATPQVSQNHTPTPMVPSKSPAYQMDWEPTEPVWDSPESPQSPWLKAYNNKHPKQEEK